MRCEFCGEPAENDSYWIMFEGDRDETPTCELCYDRLVSHLEAENVSELNWANYDNKAEVVDVVTDPTQNRVYVTVRYYENNGRDYYDVIYSGDSKKAGLAAEGETPIMPPMGFGESVNWRPHEDQNRDRRRAETSDLDCDECGAVNETVGYVDDELSFKLCEPCDRDWMAKQGYEAEMASLSEIIFEDEAGNKYTTHPDFDHSIINDMIWDEDLVPMESETVRFNSASDAYAMAYSQGHAHGRRQQPYDPKLSKEDRDVFTGAWKTR